MMRPVPLLVAAVVLALSSMAPALSCGDCGPPRYFHEAATQHRTLELGPGTTPSEIHIAFHLEAPKLSGQHDTSFGAFVQPWSIGDTAERVGVILRDDRTVRREVVDVAQTSTPSNYNLSVITQLKCGPPSCDTSFTLKLSRNGPTFEGPFSVELDISGNSGTDDADPGGPLQMTLTP